MVHIHSAAAAVTAWAITLFLYPLTRLALLTILFWSPDSAAFIGKKYERNLHWFTGQTELCMC